MMSDLHIPKEAVEVVDELTLVRNQIARNYGFAAPEAFVADLMAYVDGKTVPGWSGGRSLTFWQTLGARYDFNPTVEYVTALRVFVNDLERLREGETK